MRILGALALVPLVVWPAPSGDATVLTEADRAFLAATDERGLDGWLEWFAPDALVLGADGRVLTDPDEIRAYYGAIAFPPPRFSWEPEKAELAESGEIGYTIGSWSLRAPGSAPEAEPMMSGRYLSIWTRQDDGSFRVLADTGGEPDFRTRLAEAGAPPTEWSSRTERLEVAESGELAFAIGSWKARTAKRELAGKHLTVWRKGEGEAWEIAAEIGFDHAP